MPGWPESAVRVGRTVRACRGRESRTLAAAPSPAIFLDRDGTIIVNQPHNGDPDLVQLTPGASAALRALRNLGFRLIVVTNQSGIARGIFDVADLTRVHARVNRLLATEGVWIDAYYYCPHHLDGVVRSLAKSCWCRKPNPGMLLRAARDWSVDLGRSWMLGDMPSDLNAGEASGCHVLGIGESSGIPGPWLAGLLDAALVIEALAGPFSTHGSEARLVARRS